MDDNPQNQIDQPKTEGAPQNPLDPTTSVQTPAGGISASAGSGSVKPKLPAKLSAALIIFSLAGGVAAAVLPFVAKGFGNGDQPTVPQLAITGVVMIIFTTILLSYVARTIGLGKAWLLMAILYNSAIAIIKFVISPSALYGQVYIAGSEPFSSVSPLGNILTGVVVVLLYVLAFKLIYAASRKRLQRNLSSQGNDDQPKPKLQDLGFKIALGIAVAVGTGFCVLFILPFFSGASYLVPVFIGGGSLLIGALMLALFGAIGAFERVTATAIELRDGSILATFFWLGLSLILIYHALWIIYMTVMVSIWPFKIIAPSGK